MHLPVRFSASFSEAGQEPGIHVKDLKIIGGGTLTNDTDIPVDQFAKGIQVVCDADLEQGTVRRRPVCFVTLEVPYPLNDVDMKLWGGDETIGFQPLVLAASANADNNSIYWTLNKETILWLEQRLFQILRKLKRETRVLARLTVLGNFIWQEKSPEMFLDGDVFGIQRQENRAPVPTELRLPSGDGRRGGKFEMWFWLVPARESKVSITIEPRVTSLVTAQKFSFTVTVVGTDNTKAVLSVEGVPGGNEVVGTIVQTPAATDWTYTAPTIEPASKQVTITATSDADKTQTATATVTIIVIR